MSSLQSTSAAVQLKDYMTLVIFTAAGYDYVLTFSKEIEYIWNKPWTWVSTLFILVRYIGIFTLVGNNIASFLITQSCRIILIVSGWTFILFVAAANSVIMLRTCAMYNGSRLIFWSLLSLLIISTVPLVVTQVIAETRPRLVPTVQIHGTLTCHSTILEMISPVFIILSAAFQITYGAVMCTLAIVQFARQSLEMYRMTKRWQFDRYMSLLVKQGILYFFAIFVLSVVSLLDATQECSPHGWRGALAIILRYVPAFTMTPRFVMSIRQLHARDVQGRCMRGIDSGFGLSQSGGIGGSEGISMEVIAVRTL